MGKITGFMEYDREVESYLPVEDRTKNYKEFTVQMPKEALQKQGARCMDCGIPFCHSGCPLGNLIPDFNQAVYDQNWELAAKILHSTNNFPEFTGRLCPAPCEAACVLGINEPPVTIENIEKNIVEVAFENGWIQADPPSQRTGRMVAVIGGGPAGMAAAQQLNRAGHTVTLFERDEKIGGLLRYGIPDFKMEKHIIDRRLEVMKEEGIIFETGVHVGVDITGEELEEKFDAILLTTGSTVGRVLNIPGAELEGVHLAMNFLKQSNQRVDGIKVERDEILATDKHVIVIGGGDTGSDCIGTSNRQGAKSVTNFEILTKPSDDRSPDYPWPYYPVKMRTSSSHQEGVERNWSINTKAFKADEKGNLKSLQTVEVAWKKDKNGRMSFQEVEGSEKDWPCDLVLLALGFTGPEKETVVGQLGLQVDGRGNIKAGIDNYSTSKENVFAAGDARRGQSLIVWAISEGREAAYHLDKYLMGVSDLPLKGGLDIPRR